MWPFSRKPARPQQSPLERYNRLRELGWNEYDASRESGFTPGQGPNGGPFGACPMCLAARGDAPTGRNAREWENANNYRAEELGRAQAERYTAEHRYQRPAEPERYNAQHEISWTEAEAERAMAQRENWMEEQIRTHGLTPDMGIAWRAGQAGEVDYSQPTASEQAYLGAGQQPRLEARNNDGSTDLPANFTGSVGNFAHASLRQARADAGGQYVTIRGQQVWVED